MPDKDSVIDGLDEISHYDGEQMFYNDIFIRGIADKAIALLKEQEAVAVHDPGAYCPKCGWILYPEDHPHRCGNCGQVVKWI